MLRRRSLGDRDEQTRVKSNDDQLIRETRTPDMFNKRCMMELIRSALLYLETRKQPSIFCKEKQPLKQTIYLLLMTKKTITIPGKS